MQKYLSIFLIAFLAIFLFLPNSSFAASDLVINEVMYDLKEVADANHEWIELYNAGSQDINLNDFKFNDGSNHNLNAPPQNGSRGSLLVPAGGFLILTGNASTTVLDFPNYSGSIIDTVMSLNNTSATLKIIDKDGMEITSASYSKEMGANGNGKTLSWDGTAFKESADDGGTPGEKNIVSVQPQEPPALLSPPPPPPPPVQEEQVQSQSPAPEPAATSTAQTSVPLKNYSDKIFINEFLPAPNPSPEGSKEWVELFSQDPQTIDLSNWQIDDAPEASSAYKIPDATLIEPNQYLVIELNKNILNNDGDEVRLIRPDGQVLHSVAYQKAEAGQSSSRFENQWLWTNQPTPGKENKKSAESITDSAPTTKTNEQAVQIKKDETTKTAPAQTPQTAPQSAPQASAPLIAAVSETVSEPKNEQKNTAPKNSSAKKESAPQIAGSPDQNQDQTQNQSFAAIGLINQTPPSNNTQQKNLKTNPLLALGGIIILSSLAAGGLIYFKRKILKATIDNQKKQD